MNKTRILVVKFKNILQKNEIEMFRGAILSKIKNNSNILFHNHTENGFRYAYPLIQYKRIDQKGAILCLEEGVDVIGKVLSVSNDKIMLGNRSYMLEINDVKSILFDFKVSNDTMEYQIRKWIPLNKDNFNKYSSLPGIVDKYTFLEKILVGNILSCAKGLGIHFDTMITCHIIQIEEPVLEIYKGIQFLSFDLKFKTNVSLPDYIGLGKGTSLNHGTTVRINNEL